MTQQPDNHDAPEQDPVIQTPNDEEITYFAQTNYRQQHVRFGIKQKDRRRHMYLIGKTGMGKSTLLENMIIQDIQGGKGVAVVDPHGDLVEKVINYVPSHRINDVVYVNPADLDYPVAFNILENVGPEYRNLVSNGLVGVFKKIWADSWGPRLEYILINAILALMEYPGSTLLGVTRMLVDNKYRKKVVAQVSDPVVRSFWVDEYNNYSDKFRAEAIAPIQNKVGQFLSSALIRNIVGQPKSTFEMRDAMDSGKIILLNLSKGRIGEENSALLGAMMITKMQLAAMSRVDIPEEQRRDFQLYVDEFQNFSTESFAGILSEARKYRFNITMAHQYVEQLTPEVRAAVFGNVGTMISFRVGAQDAELLEKEFEPTFTREDLVTLPSYYIYLRLMIDGVASEPFSATTLPPVEGRTENREKVIRVSRERYSTRRDIVEKKIAEWAGLDASYIRPVVEEKPESVEEPQGSAIPPPPPRPTGSPAAQQRTHQQQYPQPYTPAGYPQQQQQSPYPPYGASPYGQHQHGVQQYPAGYGQPQPQQQYGYDPYAAQRQMYGYGQQQPAAPVPAPMPAPPAPPAPTMDTDATPLHDTQYHSLADAMPALPEEGTLDSYDSAIEEKTMQAQAAAHAHAQEFAVQQKKEVAEEPSKPKPVSPQAQKPSGDTSQSTKKKRKRKRKRKKPNNTSGQQTTQQASSTPSPKNENDAPTAPTPEKTTEIVKPERTTEPEPPKPTAQGKQTLNPGQSVRFED